MNETKTMKGAIFITLAFFFVALMGAISKITKQVPLEMLIFFQSFIALVLFTPVALKKNSLKLKKGFLKFNFLRSCAGLFSQVLMLIAVRKILMANAVLLSNSAPLIIPLLAKLFLKRKINPKTLLSIGAGLFGIILILNPTRNIFENNGSMLALGSAFFSAVALLSINEISKVEPSEQVLFYYFLLSSLMTAPFAISHWKNPPAIDWSFLVGIGLCMLMSQLLIIKAYKYATPSKIAPFNYTVVIFSTLLGGIFWNEWPGATSILGMLLVCAGGIYSIISTPSDKNETNQQKSGGIYEYKNYAR